MIWGSAIVLSKIQVGSGEFLSELCREGALL